MNQVIRSLAFLCPLLALSARAAEVVIDDFEGPLKWTHNPDGGTRSVRLEKVRAPVVRGANAERVKSGKAAGRLTYANAHPGWSNLQHPVSVPPNAVAIAVWLTVHSAEPGAAMHFWLLEPDGDGWVARLQWRGKGLNGVGPGWQDIVIPVSEFRFEPRGNKTREMTSADRMLLGCNFADLDVTIDDLRFMTREGPAVTAPSRRQRPQVQSGRKGRVAVLADDLPGSSGAASPPSFAKATEGMAGRSLGEGRPQEVAGIAREAGYGATLLDSVDVADPTILTRGNFDALIVPCAPAYPLEGRRALLAFLKAGGSLVSIGGYAFDELLVRTSDAILRTGVEGTRDGWAAAELATCAADMDKTQPAAESINTRRGRHGDTMRLEPDQIGAFDPSYLLEHAAYAATAPGQVVLRKALRIEGPLEGYAACAMTGSNSPVFPEVHGRWIPILNAYDSFGRLRGAAAAVVHHWRGPFAGSSWALFGVTNRDLISEAGGAGEGGDPAGPALLRAALGAVVEATFLHGLKTEFACYREGEPVRVRVEVTNNGRTPRDLVVRFGGDGLDAAERAVSVAPGQTRVAESIVHGGVFDRDFYVVTAELAEAGSGRTIDRMSTAFVVWDEGVIRSGPKIALKDNYFTWNGVPRFFCGTNQTGMMWHSEHEDPRVWERDFAKMRASGIRMLRILHFSPFAADDPPGWGKQGVFVLKNRPKKLLRQTDAIVQLAQKHGVAICLTFHDWMPVELSDAELEAQRDWNRFWARRYRDVPGIIYDVQNEPSVRFSQKPDLVRFYNDWLKARYKSWEALSRAWGRSAPQGEPWTLKPEAGSDDWADVKALDANRFLVATLDRWVKKNVEGVREGDPEALVTVGYLPSMRPADKVLGVRHTDFSNMHYYGSVDRFGAEFKIIDRRFVGKSFSLGEFGAQEAHDARTHGRTGTAPDVSIRRFLATTHYAFGLGASFVLNWDWKDFDDCVFPWGLCHPCDLVGKPVLVAYRNTSMFLERLRPRYEDPGLYLLLPDSHRLGARWREVHAAIYRATEALLANHVNFNVANEDDLDRLPAACRAICWPVPYCPEDAAFERVLAFVRRGGALYLSGDVAYDALRRRSRVRRLAELGLKDVGERPPFAKPSEGVPSGVQRATARREPQGRSARRTTGRGKVFYVPRPIELDGGPVAAAQRRDLQMLSSVAETLREFLAFAGVRRIAVEPDHPKLHVFTIPLAARLNDRLDDRLKDRLNDGSVTVVCNRTGAGQEVRLPAGAPGGATLAVGRELTGLLATNRRGQVVAVECTGRSASGDGPITSGDAHVMIASLDDRDLGLCKRLVVFPITAGSLTIHTRAHWRSPILQVGEPDGPGPQDFQMRTLARMPLRVEGGALTIEIEPRLLRSVLIVRERDAAAGGF